MARCEKARADASRCAGPTVVRSAAGRGWRSSSTAPGRPIPALIALGTGDAAHIDRLFAPARRRMLARDLVERSGTASLYMALYAILIIILRYFYTAFVLDPDESRRRVEEVRRRRCRASRPERRPPEYLDGVMSRISMIGAAYFVLVCLIPELSDLLGAGAVLFRRHVVHDHGVHGLDIDAQVRGAGAESAEKFDPEVPNGAWPGG